MGKGDKKSKKGKIFRKSFGKSRPKQGRTQSQQRGSTPPPPKATSPTEKKQQPAATE